MEKHSGWWAYVASISTALFGGLTLQDVAIWVGIITALGTFGMNWYYRARRDAREEHLLVYRNATENADED